MHMRRTPWWRTCWRATRRKASAPSSTSGSRNGRTAERPIGRAAAPLSSGMPMNHDSYPDAYIRGILNTVKTIAMVGISPKDVRPSYFAFKYLLERGYRMIPVNPGQVGGDILGQPVYAKLADIPEPIDMVDV